MVETFSPADLDEILRNDFMTFTERSFYELSPQAPFSMSFFLEVMAKALTDCVEGRCKRLIINLPPRSLKSIMCSVALPAIILGRDPSKNIICASYGQDLADKHARDTRTVMLSPFYKQLFPGTRLSPNRLATADFETTRRGGRMATSVGGVLTGRGADFILIDDPQKPDEAMSETKRKGTNGWFDNSLVSRLDNKDTGVIIIIMQRLHQDDLVGHVLEQESWRVVSFPAIAEEDETHLIVSPLGHRTHIRRVGEVLNPERESLESLLAMKNRMGSFGFSSQYQQNPIPVGGAMIKTEWLRFYTPADLPETFTYILQSWDTANKSDEIHDYSVCTTWGVKCGHYYLLDVFRRRLEYPDLKRAIREESRRYRYPSILIEDRASGTQLIQDLKREGLIRIRPYEPPPQTDKILRVFAQTHLFEGGRVHLPSEAAWKDVYIRELISFPGAKYDDQVDSTTQALHHMGSHNSLEIWARL